jgi:hypothetical protein
MAEKRDDCHSFWATCGYDMGLSDDAWQKEPQSHKAIESSMRVYLGLLALFVAMYFLIHSFFVFTIPTDHSLATKGFVCAEDALRLPDVARLCPFVPLEKIKDFGYETDMIWTGWSVSLIQFLILALWIACFYALAFFLAAFVVNQQNKASKART